MATGKQDNIIGINDFGYDCKLNYSSILIESIGIITTHVKTEEETSSAKYVETIWNPEVKIFN